MLDDLCPFRERQKKVSRGGGGGGEGREKTVGLSCLGSPLRGPHRIGTEFIKELSAFYLFSSPAEEMNLIF